jgi:hypothetical protein
MKARQTIVLTAAFAVGLGLAASAFGHGFGQGYGGRGMMEGAGPRADCPYAQQQVAQRFQHGHHMGWQGQHRYDQRGQGLRDGTGPRENCPLFDQAQRAPQDTTEDAG